MTQLTENKKILVAVLVTSLITGFGGYLIGKNLTINSSETPVYSKSTCPHHKQMEMKMKRHEMLMHKHQMMMQKHYQMMQEHYYGF